MFLIFQEEKIHGCEFRIEQSLLRVSVLCPRLLCSGAFNLLKKAVFFELYVVAELTPWKNFALP
jgi:hypothetical protein